jgi:hypothetical protein
MDILLVKYEIMIRGNANIWVAEQFEDPDVFALNDM